MTSPKPIVLTHEATNPETNAPEPLVIVGDIPDAAVEAAVLAYLEGIADYDAAETQTLKNVTGTLTWVNDA